MADFNIFGSAPEYLTGLLGQQGVEDLQKKALTTGLINAAIGYIAQPKNQRLGGPLPYIGRALQAGMTGAQGVYDQGLKNFEVQQKIDEINRQKQQRADREAAIAQLPPEQQALYRAYGESAVSKLVEAAMPKPQERKTSVVGNRVVDTGTGEVVYEAPTEAKARATKEVDAGNKILIVDSSTGETIREIPKGLAPQSPKAPDKVNYTVQTDASGNAVYVPNVPGLPVLDMSGKPTAYKPAPTAAEAKVQEKQAQAKKLPKLISEAESLIQGATGSYLGAGADIAARTVGISTEGAKNIASLKALEANLVLSMPRLEGPQSNLDQQLYREAAAQIGDPTVPAGTKQAALNTIKRINTTYDGGTAPAQTNQQVNAQPIPKVGAEKGGYVFKGGNPNDPKSWIKKGK